ncbi:MAG: hypothetical protein IJA61_03020 [Clostridia bacterium]|nr:hypothetical protein [Clostridia bacterium]
MHHNLTFNRVLGLKFLHDHFPYYFSPNRIQLYFAHSKKELLELNIVDNFDTLLLKRSGNNKTGFYSDIRCKDNRFFRNIEELKCGIGQFKDMFDFCIECHKFRNGENYYSDRLAIAQFSTENIYDQYDTISFIPSLKPGISTRDNLPYLMIDYPYNSESLPHIKKLNNKAIKENHFSDVDISYLAKTIHRMIDNIRNYLLDLNIRNSFQLIIRIDSYLNILPIDFRTPEAWSTLK